MYQCSQVNQTTNECDTWVEVSILGLPPLTESEANTLMAEVVGIWALALVVAVLVRTVAQRKL